MTEQKKSFPLYPLFVKLDGRACLVVGGGAVAERKAAGLVEAGAAVTVVSPQATEGLRELAQQGLISWQQKAFAPSAIEGAFLVIAATGDAAVNAGIAAACRAAAVPVNVVDEPELCDFLVPSVVRRGSLAIAVSTAGKSPGLARKLRAELEQQFSGPYEEFLDLLGEQRKLVKQRVPDPARREAILRALAESDIFDLLAAGKRAEAKERIQKCISSQQD